MELLSVGEAFEDLIFAGLDRLPRAGEELRVPTFVATFGGGAVITAVAAARLGLRVGLMSALASEPLHALARERVEVVNLQRPNERGAISAALSTRRDRSFVTFEGVNRSLEARLLQHLSRFRTAPRHVHFALSPRDTRAWLSVVERFRATGATTSWDFGWNERLPRTRGFMSLIRSVDWLLVNEQEAKLYSGERSLAAARRRLASVAERVVIKMGARGADLLSAGVVLRSRAARARVLDTTGAGDAFNGGFLAAMLRSNDAAEALRLGNFIGARSTEALGGIDGLPARAALPSWARRCLEAA